MARKPRRRYDICATSNKNNRLCGARIRIGPAKLARAAKHGPAEVEKLLRRTYCRNPPMVGRTRCRLHGGKSTGPRTPEGIARCANNLKQTNIMRQKAAADRKAAKAAKEAAVQAPGTPPDKSDNGTE